MVNAVLFSSSSDEWATPQEIFDELNSEFSFNLDVCATSENHKCNNYFTAETDGLTKSWGGLESFATRHIVKLASGLRSLITRALSQTL